MEAWFMSVDLRTLYEKYVDYVTRLRDDFDRHVGTRVPEKYRPQLLSFDDFCETWQRWGRIESLQETWERRLNMGYDRVAEALSKQLEAAFATAGDGCEGTSFARAA
jgi:hypothetical protein